MARDNKECLEPGFFRREPKRVAEELLGKYLVTDFKSYKELPIYEVELYCGEDDKASHASKGLTKRTKVMYEAGGKWYVYLIYGIYNMLNVVVGENSYPAAVLIRAAGECDGPGKLTKYLEIDRGFNDHPISRKTGLWIEDRGIKVEKGDIWRKPRVGIDYAKEPWKSRKWRFGVDLEGVLH